MVAHLKLNISGGGSPYVLTNVIDLLLATSRMGCTFCQWTIFYELIAECFDSMYSIHMKHNNTTDMTECCIQGSSWRYGYIAEKGYCEVTAQWQDSNQMLVENDSCWLKYQLGFL
jgi:hypothetical protein